MKTIGERRREIEESNKAIYKKLSIVNRERIDEIIKRGIVRNSAMTFEQLEGFQDRIADGVEPGNWANVACDHCKTEMWKGRDMNFCLGAEYQYTCPGCGWSTYASGSL